MNPSPRDFTTGIYKFKTSPFDEIFPTDEDLAMTVRDGLPGTGMPGWSDLLSEKDIRGLVTYIKGFAGIEESVTKGVEVTKRVRVSDESIAQGKDLFIDRCAECHGEEGRGDASKRLKTDWGERVWPRNLTRPWTYRYGSNGEDMYKRISTGIPGTPMPSFADPENKKRLTEEERWHVVNYIESIHKEAPIEGESVVKVIRVEGEISDDPMSPQWKEGEATTFPLMPQIIARERHFTPTFTEIAVSGLYNSKEVAFLLEWDDRTKSIPGDLKAIDLSDGDLFSDAVAIQWPAHIPGGLEKPYFGHGDGGHPVNIWYWNSGTTTTQEGIKLLDATGLGRSTPREGNTLISGKGIYKNGQWRVVIKRSLQTDEKERDIQFDAGKFIPVAFAAWDGNNGETGSRHVLTTWYWAFLRPPGGVRVIVIPVAVIIMVFGGEVFLARQVQKS